MVKPLVLALMLLAPLSAAAATYYVDPGRGSDENDGRSAAAAWRTIEKANA